MTDIWDEKPKPLASYYTGILYGTVLSGTNGVGGALCIVLCSDVCGILCLASEGC